jgi:uncharacterized protein (TIGR01244 family)
MNTVFISFRRLAMLYLCAASIFVWGSAGCASLKGTGHGGEKITSAEVGQTPNLTTFGGHVYFAPQPATQDFKAFAERGVTTVINLRTDAEMQFDERAAVRAAGMKYIHVPIGHTAPADEDLNQIMDTLDQAGKEPVLLHCASSNRVGYVWAMYRASRQGLAADAAIAEGKAAGLKSPELEKLAREYIARTAKPQ